jgi:hypothetical protein
LSKPFHQHSSAVATMIDPCDRLLFDQVSSGSPEFRRGESEKAPLRK